MKDSHRKPYLIIGADGLTGSYLSRLIDPSQCTGTYYKREVPGSKWLDILDFQAVEQLIDDCQPRVVFHCANLAGGINYCEQNPEVARAFHFNATVNIASICSKRGIWFAFISTETVFPDIDGMVGEDVLTGAMNIYGQCKREAEEWIIYNLDRYTIVRTINVYGWDPESPTPNYLMQLYRALSNKKEFTAPSYLKGSPIYAEDLAAALLELVNKQKSGVYHVVGPDYIDRFEWALRFAGVMDLDRNLILESSSPDSSFVGRPMRIILDTGKFYGNCTTAIRSVEEGMLCIKKESQ